MEPELIEKIESYLNDQIDRSELDQYASQYDIADLDREVQWVKEMQLAIEAEGLNSQLSILLKERGNAEVPIQSGKISQMIPWSIAAALVLLFGIFFIMKPDRYEKLYSKYEYTDAGLPILMSETEQYRLYDAMTYFSEGDYETALEKFRGMGVENDTVQYYTALSLYYSGGEKEAIRIINQIALDNYDVFHDKAQWILSLELLKEKEIGSLKHKLLSIIVDPDHEFREEAQSLIDELN